MKFRHDSKPGHVGKRNFFHDRGLGVVRISPQYVCEFHSHVLIVPARYSSLKSDVSVDIVSCIIP